MSNGGVSVKGWGVWERNSGISVFTHHVHAKTYITRYRRGKPQKAEQGLFNIPQIKKLYTVFIKYYKLVGLLQWESGLWKATVL